MHFFECKCSNFDYNFDWALFLRVELIIFQHWCRHGLVPTRRQAIDWTNGGISLTHTCVTRPQCVEWTGKLISIARSTRYGNAFTSLAHCEEYFTRVSLDSHIKIPLVRGFDLLRCCYLEQYVKQTVDLPMFGKVLWTFGISLKYFNWS